MTQDLESAVELMPPSQQVRTAQAQPSYPPAPPITDLGGAHGVFDRIRQRLQMAVRGRDQVVEVMIIALLSDGHMLLDGQP